MGISLRQAAMNLNKKALYKLGVVQAPHAGGLQQRTLADIILLKIQDTERAQGQPSTSG